MTLKQYISEFLASHEDTPVRDKAIRVLAMYDEILAEWRSENVIEHTQAWKDSFERLSKEVLVEIAKASV